MIKTGHYVSFDRKYLQNLALIAVKEGYQVSGYIIRCFGVPSHLVIRGSNGKA